jgi:hypothetical protein
MRFSLLTLFGVMTAVAVLLGMPGYIYMVAVVLVVSHLALNNMDRPATAKPQAASHANPQPTFARPNPEP